MATIYSASKIATMEFEFIENGVTRTAMIQMTARRTGDSQTDLTFEVGQILVAAIQAQTGYTLTKAHLLEESSTQVYPPA